MLRPIKILRARSGCLCFTHPLKTKYPLPNHLIRQFVEDAVVIEKIELRGESALPLTFSRIRCNFLDNFTEKMLLTVNPDGTEVTKDFTAES
jgi:hypothetical protein